MEINTTYTDSAHPCPGTGVELDSLLPGLTTELPETGPLATRSPVKDIRMPDELEEVFTRAENTRVAIKPTSVPYFWRLGIEDDIYVLDADGVGSIQEAATRHNISFVTMDVFGAKKALHSLGLTQTVDCIALQQRILDRNAAPKRIPVNQMVSVFQENELELARRSNLGWYGLLRDTQDLAASPGFRVDQALFRTTLEAMEASGVKVGTITACKKMLEACEGNVFPVRYTDKGAVTGRFSTSKPNIHGLDKRMRKALFAPDGKVLVSADYHQAHPRILYSLSRDENLGRPFLEGKDIYKHLAGLAFDKAPSEVTDAEREVGKKLCLGFVYDITAKGIERELSKAGVENAGVVALQIEEKLQQEFQTFFQWKRQARTKRSEYVTQDEDNPRTIGAVLPSGRVIWYEPKTQELKGFYSHLAQGIEVEIVADAIKRFTNGLRSENLAGAGLMLCHHDELIAYCEKRDAEKVALLLKQSMENAFESYPKMVKTVNLVEISGPSECWGDLK